MSWTHGAEPLLQPRTDIVLGAMALAPVLLLAWVPPITCARPHSHVFLLRGLHAGHYLTAPATKRTCIPRRKMETAALPAVELRSGLLQVLRSRRCNPEGLAPSLIIFWVFTSSFCDASFSDDHWAIVGISSWVWWWEIVNVLSFEIWEDYRDWYASNWKRPCSLTTVFLCAFIVLWVASVFV